MLHHLVSYFVSETNQAVRPHRWQRSLSLCYSFPAMSGKAFGMHRPLTKGTGLWSGIISPTFCDLATFFLIIASFANLRFCFVRWRMGTFFMVRPLVTFNIFLLARVYVAMTFILFSCLCGWGGIVEWVLWCLMKRWRWNTVLEQSRQWKCALSVFPTGLCSFLQGKQGVPLYCTTRERWLEAKWRRQWNGVSNNLLHNLQCLCVFFNEQLRTAPPQQGKKYFSMLFFLALIVITIGVNNGRKNYKYF